MSRRMLFFVASFDRTSFMMEMVEILSERITASPRLKETVVVIKRTNRSARIQSTHTHQWHDAFGLNWRCFMWWITTDESRWFSKVRWSDYQYHKWLNRSSVGTDSNTRKETDPTLILRGIYNCICLNMTFQKHTRLFFCQYEDYWQVSSVDYALYGCSKLRL